MGLGMMLIKLASGFVALVICMKWTGTKGISNLTPIDFIWSIMLSEIFGNGLYDPQVKWYVVLIMLLVWCAIKLLFDKIMFHTDKVEILISGEEVLIIRDSKPDHKMLKKHYLDLRDLKEALRKQSIFSIDEVEHAYLEKDGSVTVKKKAAFEPVTKGDLNIKV
ncbi:DUF421 domain-containing protein [Bacillus sp. FJAT-27231]|uniref:DUF421 domain-containing protein n=1 Tax=Bacillus sp. FJAT-27231 TaxID=1679168 RepID=UPI000671522A|nr:YetF domain-containing protein [Bacillus sp. FJAT-27231]